MLAAHYSPRDVIVLQHARNVASTFGLALANAELLLILWEQTSFPLSDPDRLTADLERAFRAFATGHRLCERCGTRTDAEFHVQSGGLCGVCLADYALPLTRIDGEGT